MSGAPTRCPFCREELQPEAPEALRCRSCTALHHRECFAEGEGCSACRSEVARRGRVLLELSDLRALDEEAWAKVRARADRRPERSLLWVNLGALVLVCAALGGLAGRGAGSFTLGSVIGALFGALAAVAIATYEPRPQRLVIGDAPPDNRAHFDAILGVWRDSSGLLSHEALPPELADAPRPPERELPDEPLPAACWDCGGELEPGEEPLWACYHCGVELVGEDGRWRTTGGESAEAARRVEG
ncbi:MAG TPA: hypothetical protein DEA08_07335 [Planctomycetes bacterium]|nr:hypothetical protein [Planctomycetota bacterium]